MMLSRRAPGVTLVEVLVVVSIVAIVIASLFALWLQSARVHARTSNDIEPHHSQMLAFKRMESEMREAMLINVHSDQHWVGLILPAKNEADMNIVNGTELQEGRHICYFQGSKEGGSNWSAVPNPVGTVLFRTTSDEPIDEPAASYNRNEVTVIIEDLAPTPMIPDPDNPGEEIATDLFTYAPLDDNGTPDDPIDDRLTVHSQLIRITLTVPVEKVTREGRVTENSTLSTEFALRNLGTPTPAE